MRRLIIILLFLALPMYALAAPVTVADLNADEQVDIFDLSILLSNWEGSGAGDINSSGNVDIYDLSILLSGMSPGQVEGAAITPMPIPTPPPTSAPTPTPTPSCDSNYSESCVPIASDVDCAGGSGDGPAYFSGVAKVVGTDVYQLDRDKDGWACEQD